MGCTASSTHTLHSNPNLYHLTNRFPTPLLAAKAYDRAAYYVRGQAAITNLGIAAAKEDLRSLGPKPYSPALQRSLDAAIAQLRLISSGGGLSKIGTQQRIGDNIDGHSGAIGAYQLSGMTTRLIAGMMAGAGPPSEGMLEAMASAIDLTGADEMHATQSLKSGRRRRRANAATISTDSFGVPGAVRVLVLTASRTLNQERKPQKRR